MKYDLVIFDLDGTLIDTSPGIFGSVRHAEKMMNLKPIREEELRDFVGPPPKEIYKMKYHLSEEDALKATKFHRKYGMEKAVNEAKLYDGMREVLEKLKNQHTKLAVATLKKQTIANTILENFSIGAFFDSVVGMNEAETLTKKMTIEKSMCVLGTHNAVMVGDSEYDYKGAMDASIDFIGVLYGFGFNNENDYPFQCIHSPRDLLNIV